MKKYCITTVTDGARVMMYPHNARGTHDSEKAARDHLHAIIINNPESVAAAFLGDFAQVRVLPVECYAGGDPKRVYFPLNEGDLSNVWKHLDLSTAHMTGADNVRLISGDNIKIRYCSHKYGFIIFVNSEYARQDIINSGLSNDFLEVYKFAVKNGCSLINFDSDGGTIDGLHVNNW